MPPERLVEWPELTDLPVVARRATDAEWPDAPVTDGRRLLDSLGLPPELLARRGSLASGPFVARPSPSSGEAAEDQRGDQERGCHQRERERPEAYRREPRRRGGRRRRRPLDGIGRPGPSGRLSRCWRERRRTSPGGGERRRGRLRRERRPLSRWLRGGSGRGWAVAGGGGAAAGCAAGAFTIFSAASAGFSGSDASFAVVRCIAPAPFGTDIGVS